MKHVEFELPWPPTANHIWKRNQRSTYLSRDYKAFLDACWMGVRIIHGLSDKDWSMTEKPVRVELALHPPKNMRYDIDNRIKPTLDAITKLRKFWKDDSQVRHLTVAKSYPKKGGCVTVYIEELV